MPHSNPRRLLLFAPGAGAPSSSTWMHEWAGKLGAFGDVVPFDYRYQVARRPYPDRMPVLIEAHREALARARAQHPGAAIILIGKSMGSRIGCHLSLEEPPGSIHSLICLGYPLRGVNGKLRDEVLLALRTRILFVQGTRDKLCPLSELEDVRARMSAPHALHIVEEGDHSLRLPGKAGKPGSPDQDASDGRVVTAIQAFLAS